jgi:hypothetical protein
MKGLILYGSDDGAWQFGLFSFWTLSTIQYLRNTAFQKLCLFPSSGVRQGMPTLLGLLERPSLNHLRLKTETSSFRNVVFFIG